MSENTYATKEEMMVLEAQFKTMVECLSMNMGNLTKTVGSMAANVEKISNNIVNPDSIKLMISDHKDNCMGRWKGEVEEIIDAKIGKATIKIILGIVGSVATLGAMIYLGLK